MADFGNPNARARRTKSAERKRRTSARIIRVAATQLIPAIVQINVRTLTPVTATTSTTNTTKGMLQNRSITRRTRRSNQPPRDAAKVPKTTASSKCREVAPATIKMVGRLAHRSREKMSRPSASVPVRCDAAGPCSVWPRSSWSGSSRGSQGRRRQARTKTANQSKPSDREVPLSMLTPRTRVGEPKPHVQSDREDADGSSKNQAERNQQCNVLITHGLISETTKTSNAENRFHEKRTRHEKGDALHKGGQWSG